MKNGFALVEAMIVIAILGILLAVAYPQYKKYKDPKWKPGHSQQTHPEKFYKKDSFECICGYKFVLDRSGNPIQIIGSNGNGVGCF